MTIWELIFGVKFDEEKYCRRADKMLKDERLKYLHQEIIRYYYATVPKGIIFGKVIYSKYAKREVKKLKKLITKHLKDNYDY